jgi:16S rRNA (cytosine967-C5)-methyltransferase
MDKVPGLAPRRAALTLLDAVLRRGQPLESALGFATRGLDKPEDRAFARAIASETLRRLPDLDALIDSATAKNLPDDAKARMVLRLALAQALVLETPEHAAVATALPLVDGGPRRLVHGVLGALLRQKVKLPDIPTLPDAVLSRWDEELAALAGAAMLVPPVIDLTLRNASETQDWTERLGGESLMPGHVRIPRGTAIPELPGYADGAWWVQNIAAAIPARLLGAGEGRALLDLCAAPGGKTMQLAAAGWQVTALDQDRARLVRLEDNLARTGLSARLVTADLMRWEPPAPVPAILLDAPCSSTGIFTRHPDVLHRVRPRDIAQLAEVQSSMIQRVARWLQPGGTLIYATCSLERQEGEEQIDVAEAAGLTLSPIEPQEIGAGILPDPKGWLRVLPFNHADGFFIVRFKRL